MFFAPTTSVSVPRLVPLEPVVSPVIAAVPPSYILPEASGVPALGRTWILEKATSHLVVPPPLVESAALTVKVMVPDAGVAVVELKVKQVLFPAIFVMVAVTVAPVLNTNPDGAVMMMVPVLMSPFAPSVMVGPVRVVYVLPVVSALIEEPPVAAVTVTVANASCGSERSAHAMMSAVVSVRQQSIKNVGR